MTDNYALELQIAMQAVRMAATLCQSVQNDISYTTIEKNDRSPVTIADFGSQAIICRALRETFALDPIIAEENSTILRQTDNPSILQRVTTQVATYHSDANENNVCQWIDFGGASEYCDRFWTLDPIDGTKGFLRNGQYAISLSLIVNGQIDLAILACPNLPLNPAESSDTTNASKTPSTHSTGALFTAVRGFGAFVQPLKDDNISPQPIHVSQTTNTADARFCESVESGHSSHVDAATIASLLNITSTPIRFDSQAKYAVVARGEADIYLRLPTSANYVEKIWDHAGGLLVVTEAGGSVTDITGKSLDFTHGAKLTTNRGVIVTNSSLHDYVLAAVNEAGVA